MPETKSLAEAMALLQTKLPEIRKSETAKVETKGGGSYSYNYANLATISAQVMSLLGEHGLSFICKPTFSGDRFVLAYKLLHTSGEHEEGEYPLPVSGTPQAVGSAITYARRYCLCAVTGVSPEEDDDDAAKAQAEHTARPAAAQRRPQPQTAQRTTRPQTDPQTKLMFALIGKIEKHGELGDRDDRLAYISGVIDRQISSSEEMTSADKSKVIKAAEGWLSQLEPPDEFGDGA